MSESPEDILQLIRLKRYEQPPADFVDDFVRSFQDRQRSELLHKSARSLLWERVTTYFDDLMSPSWGWAAASVVAIASAGYILSPSAQHGPRLQVAANASTPEETFVVRALNVGSLPATDERFLIARHYDGGFTADHAHGSLIAAGLSLSDDARLMPK